MHLIDFIVFIAFTLGVVVFGCSFFKKGSSADEFTSAGHSIPGWVVGMSIFATYVSSISYIGYPGKAFAADWNAFVFSLSIPIASYFAAKYFVPFYRHSGSVSAYTFLEEKFGAWARLYASACYLLTQIARMGSILYLLAVPMYILMGWDMHTVIILTSIGIVNRYHYLFNDGWLESCYLGRCHTGYYINRWSRVVFGHLDVLNARRTYADL